MNGVKIVGLSILLSVITEGVIIWRKLLLYTDAVSHPIIGGGVVGFLVGLIWGSMTPRSGKSVILGGTVAIVTIALFDGIVYGELGFHGRVYVLYLLGSLIAGSLAFLSTKLSQGVVGKQAES
jgi:ABC-type Mn2+/Zn2+ transport system permease subunit